MEQVSLPGWVENRVKEWNPSSRDFCLQILIQLIRQKELKYTDLYRKPSFQFFQLPAKQSVSVSFSYIYMSHFYIYFALFNISTSTQEW